MRLTQPRATLLPLRSWLTPAANSFAKHASPHRVKCRAFKLCAGEMPSVEEANAQEPLRLWGGSGVQGRVVLGARVDQACLRAADLAESLSAYQDEAFAITYRCRRAPLTLICCAL